MEEITERLAQHVLESMGDEIPFLPGVRALLVELRDAGIPAAIVTNALTVIARHTAEGAPEVLTRIVSHDDVTHAKPDPSRTCAARSCSGWSRATAWPWRTRNRASAPRWPRA